MADVTTKKLTKKEILSAIKTFVNGGELTIGKDDIVGFCDNEITHLDKRSSENKERDEFDVKVSDSIATLLADKKKRSVSEIIASVPELSGKTTQFVSPLLNRLGFKKVIDKKNTYYTISDDVVVSVESVVEVKVEDTNA